MKRASARLPSVSEARGLVDVRLSMQWGATGVLDYARNYPLEPRATPGIR